MTSSFIVTVNLSSISAETLADTSDKIHDALTDDQLSVISVTPYSHPTVPDADSTGPLEQIQSSLF